METYLWVLLCGGGLVALIVAIIYEKMTARIEEASPNWEKPKPIVGRTGIAVGSGIFSAAIVSTHSLWFLTSIAIFCVITGLFLFYRYLISNPPRGHVQITTILAIVFLLQLVNLVYVLSERIEARGDTEIHESSVNKTITPS